ncbi:MAG: hypothetical protein ABEJ68_09740 [Halobacteriaceae archaeon]
MGSHETRRLAGDRSGAAPSCPLPGVAARPLSWELGERIVADDATRRRVTLSDGGGRTTVTVFEATDHTVVVAVRTPVGRQKYYEVPAAAVDRAIDEVAADERWQVTDRA